MNLKIIQDLSSMSHNPYFNRWFSAIYIDACVIASQGLSQSLF